MNKRESRVNKSIRVYGASGATTIIEWFVSKRSLIKAPFDSAEGKERGKTRKGKVLLLLRSCTRLVRAKFVRDFRSGTDPQRTI